MHLGESAAHAVSLAKQRGLPPAALRVPELQRKLAERGVMISFFNDFDMLTPEPWVPAVQVLAAMGLFRGYDAAPGGALTRETARRWVGMTGARLAGEAWSASDNARSLPADDSSGPIGGGEFAALLLREFDGRGLPRAAAERLSSAVSSFPVLSRGDTCLILYETIKELEA